LFAEGLVQAVLLPRLGRRQKVGLDFLCNTFEIVFDAGVEFGQFSELLADPRRQLLAI
jgi:hypothetical protein